MLQSTAQGFVTIPDAPPIKRPSHSTIASPLSVTFEQRRKNHSRDAL